MFNLLKEIRVLRREGKLHSGLLKRTRVLSVITFILFVVFIYNLLVRDMTVFTLLVTGIFTVLGFLLGLYVFSHMSVVNWDEEKEMVVSGRMDKLGYVTLVLYIAFEIGLRTFLKAYFPASLLPLLLSGIFGTLFGRIIGTFVEIHRVYLLNHSK